MNSNRRDFIRYTGLTGLSVTGGMMNMFGSEPGRINSEEQYIPDADFSTGADNTNIDPDEKDVSIIGLYGKWAAGLNDSKLPSLSFRRDEFRNADNWKKAASQRVTERLAIPGTGGAPKVDIVKSYTFDGLQIEELRWQLPYGRPTEAILLKPQNSKGTLPGILAFHDHGGNKYHGSRKITRTGERDPMIAAHQQQYYENFAWANEVAKRGYVVLVPDAFPFASRRVMLQDVPEFMRQGLTDDNPEKPENIEAYNKWASAHEHIMSKSLFSAGTTWPGVFYAEDRKALDILCARKDVDANRVGCGGLSGGGMRTAFMGGLDPRIKCAVCVGFMTTWKDFIINKSYTHTWMTYVPLLPNELDFPEIMALRVPLPTLVLNDEDDKLFTIGEMKNADKMLQDIYKKAGAPDRYKGLFFPGPHKFDARMQAEAFQWFDKWLK